MSSIKIWHNNECSKSRAALAFLQTKDLKIEIIDYLKNPPSKDEIKNILKLLAYETKDLFRKTEDLYLSLKINELTNENDLLNILIKNPILIQRPVIIYNNKAAIARPLDNVKELF